MISNERHAKRLKILTGVCVVFLAATVAAWLVNLELAVKVFAPSWKCIEFVLPDWIFRACVALSVDLSTVSTLVPVLIFLFPLIQGMKALYGKLHAPAPATGNEWMPYPPHFPYFLIMLGLYGTLHGLLIGLKVSGVDGFIAYRPAADAISGSLTRLLAGTSTAIWSSLLGLIGAFLTAQPIPWLFRRIVGVEQPPETVSLAQTIHSLTTDLRGLGEASREFRKTLAPEAVSGFLQKLDGIESNLQNLTGAIERTTSVLDQLAEERRQELEALRQQTAELKEISARAQHLDAIHDINRQTLSRMESIEKKSDNATALLSALAQPVGEVNTAARQAADTLTRISGELPACSLGIQQKLEGIAESNRDNLRQLREERDAFRRSMAAYLKQEDAEKAQNKA